MSADTKWEAVEPTDIKQGDTIRAVHTNGSVVIGEQRLPSAAGVLLTVPDDSHTRGFYVGRGWTFERAVPERTLPTGWGVFASRAEVKRAGENRLHFDVWMHDEDGWKNLYTNPDVAVTPDAVPEDMEPLGLVTEVEELRQRIDMAREYVDDYGNWSTFDGRRKHILALLAGEARNV